VKEKRKAKRVKKESKVTITIISKGKLPPGKKVSYHLTKNISTLGIKIRANAFIPINTRLKIQLSLTNPPKLFNAFGRVRWIKSQYSDEWFELGVEFVDTPLESIKALKEQIKILWP